MKLGITPPCSNTIFDVFLMGIAASAHGVLLSYSCRFSFFMSKVKNQVRYLSAMSVSRGTTQKDGHYSTMV